MGDIYSLISTGKKNKTHVYVLSSFAVHLKLSQ